MTNNENLNFILVRNVAASNELGMIEEKLSTLTLEQLTVEIIKIFSNNISSIQISILETGKELIRSYPCGSLEKENILQIWEQCVSTFKECNEKEAFISENKNLNDTLANMLSIIKQLESIAEKLKGFEGNQLIQEMAVDFINSITLLRKEILENNDRLIAGYPISNEEKQKNSQMMYQFIRSLEEENNQYRAIISKKVSMDEDFGNKR